MGKSEVTEILSRASTDKAFYKQATTDLPAAVASYKLSADDLTAVKAGLKTITPIDRTGARSNPGMSGAN